MSNSNYLPGSKATKTAEGAANVLKNYSEAYVCTFLQNLEFKIDFIMIFNIFCTQNWSFVTITKVNTIRNKLKD